MWRLLEGWCRDVCAVLRGSRLVPGSSVLTVLDLDEVDVTVVVAEILRSVLSGDCSNGSPVCGWRGTAEALPTTMVNTKAHIKHIVTHNNT
jgi:hypothetical protein